MVTELPPPPCEGFLCYYEAGDHYLQSSVVWKLIISLLIIFAICTMIGVLILCTNCNRGERRNNKRRSVLLTGIRPLAPPTPKTAPKAVPEDIHV